MLINTRQGDKPWGNHDSRFGPSSVALAWRATVPSRRSLRPDGDDVESMAPCDV